MNHQYNPKIHHRKSVRLQGYDYSQPGLYFITICTQNQAHLFGEIVEGEMVLNEAGKMVAQIWNEIPDHYHKFAIHEFMVMPNHIHGIIEIPVWAGPRTYPNTGQRQHNGQQQQTGQQTGQPRGVAPTGLPDIVGRYKSLTMKQYIDGVHHHGWPRFNKKLWQRNYWDHIIRNKNEYHRIAEYICNNPAKWAQDKLNVGAGPRACPNQVMESQTIYNEKAWMV